MSAVQEFLQSSGIAHVEGWVAMGESKRGIATWDIGITRCSNCVKIVGIAPLVPVVPNLRADLHRMWQAYNGFTWALQDYINVNFTQYVDTP